MTAGRNFADETLKLHLPEMTEIEACFENTDQKKLVRGKMSAFREKRHLIKSLKTITQLLCANF
jgi:hypothetical protein